MQKVNRILAVILTMAMFCTSAPEIAFASALTEEAGENEKSAENVESVVNTETTESMEETEETEVMEDTQGAKTSDARAAVDEYTFLTVGDPLSRKDAAARETFAFQPDDSGWYHIKLEGTQGMSMYATLTYIDAGKESQGGAQDWAPHHRQQEEHLFYCQAKDTYLFDIGSENGVAADYTVSVNPVEVSRVEASGEIDTVYPGENFLDYTGLQLKMFFADGESIVIHVGSAGNLEELCWSNDSRYQTYFDNYITLESFEKKEDSAEAGNIYYNIEELEDGAYTAHAYISRFDNGNQTKFEFTFDLVAERDGVESIKVLSKEKTEFTKGFFEELCGDKIEIQVNYKDGRPSKIISSEKGGAGVRAYLQLDGVEYGSVDEYLANGGSLGEVPLYVTYRGAETTCPITIYDSPYSGIDVELYDTKYYQGCGYTFGDKPYSGEFLDPGNVIRKVTLHYKDEAKGSETLEWPQLPEFYLRTTAGLKLTNEKGETGLYQYVDDFLAAGGAIGKNVYEVTYAGVATEVEVEICENPYSKIEVITPPDRTTFIVGKDDWLRTAGMVIRAYDAQNLQSYTDITVPQWESEESPAEERRILRNLNMILGGHESIKYLEKGEHDVTVFYFGHQATYPIQVVDSLISDFRITKQPECTKILAGYADTIDFSGARLSFQMGNETYTDLEVYSPEYDQLCQKYGLWIEVDSGKVAFDQPGVYPVKVSFMGSAAEFEVEIVDKMVESLEILKAPTRLEYYVGERESIELDGLELAVTGLDGKVTKYRAFYNPSEKPEPDNPETGKPGESPDPVEPDDPGEYGDWNTIADWRYYKLDISDVNFKHPGTYQAVFYYGGAGDAFPVEVKKCPVESLEVNQMPSKTSYYTFEVFSLDFSGLQLTVHFNDGTPDANITTDRFGSGMGIEYKSRYYEITSEWKNDLWVENEIAIGENAIVLSLLGVTAEIPVTIQRNPVSEVKVKKNPQCMAYPPFDAIVPDLYGAEIMLSYIDGTTETVSVQQHGSSILTEQYGLELSARFERWNNSINISVGGATTSLPLDEYVFANAEYTDTKDDQVQSVTMTKEKPYQIFRFIPEETKEYSLFFSADESWGYYLIFDETNALLREDSFWNGVCAKMELEAGKVYYFAVTDAGEGGYKEPFVCCISSVRDAFTLKEEDVAKFEITKAPQIQYYAFEKEISPDNIPFRDIEYRITCKDGTELLGRVRFDGWIYGAQLQGRFQYLTENGAADTSKDNAVIYRIGSCEAKVPVTFDAKSPVTSLEVVSQPWKQISQSEAEACDYSGFQITVNYTDGSSRNVALQKENTWIDDGYDRYCLEIRWKHYTEDGRVSVGDNAVVMTYMGAVAEVPVKVVSDLEKQLIEEVKAVLDAPVAGQPFPSVTCGADCSASVDWTNAGEERHAEYAKSYQAKINLAPKDGYAFQSKAEIWLNGKKAVSKVYNSNGTITVYATFPYTDCSVRVPEAKGYLLDQSMNATEGSVPYGQNYMFRYEKTDGKAEAIVVKADGKLLKADQDGVYTLEKVKSNTTVTAKPISEETKENWTRLNFFDREQLRDSFFAERKRTVAETGEEALLPILESYADGSDQFFFGWYQNKDASLNGTGARFCSTTTVPDLEILPLYAKWGLGIFSYIYNTKKVNYKVLSIDEDNRMKVQVGDGSKAAVTNHARERSVDATGDDGTLKIPSQITDFRGTGLDQLGIEFKGCEVVAIAEKAFSGNADIRKISLPDTITEIGSGAFRDCENLESIEIPSSVERIESGTFQGCTNLTEVVLEDGVASIADHAFEGCSSLQTVVIPDSVQEIDTTAFANGAENLTIVCSSNLTNVVADAAEAAGAKIQKVDIVCDYLYTDKEFTYGDAPFTITAKVFVDGTEIEDRSKGLLWQIPEDMRAYYTVTQNANMLIAEPKKVTEGASYPVIVRDPVSLQTKRVQFSTIAAALGQVAAVDDIPAADYTGKAVEPEVCVRLAQSKEKLVKGVDYRVEYRNNVEAGDGAEIKIIGIHNYCGEIIKNFTIQKKPDVPSTQNPGGQKVKVEKIELNETKLRMKQKSSKQLTAQISPRNATISSVTWKSSDPAVVSVSKDGKVTAMAGGTATITAEADQKTAICVITVPYSISYKLNGGKNHKSNPEDYYENSVKLKNPTRAKYTFAGWYTDAKFKKKITKIKAGDHKNYVLYAKWTKISLGGSNISSAKKLKSKKKTQTNVTVSKTKKVEVKFKKVKGADGYEIAYSTSKKFKKSATKTVMSKKNCVVLKNLKKGKTYFIRLRAYKKDSTGQKICGKWTAVRKVKIEK